MTKRVWKSGPPPHVGWWNASLDWDENVWRWWDGLEWSVACYEFDSAKKAAKLSSLKSFYPISDIQWSNYYPENALVPRINPNK